MLTGKAKEAFLSYVYGQGLEYLLIRDISLNAMIIEWLDSIGIVIDMQLVNVHIKTFEVEIVFTRHDMPSVNLGIHKTRYKATQEAILKANEIYNGN